MSTFLQGILVVAVGVVLNYNPQWFTGADVVGTVLIIGGAIIAGVALFKSL